ncbi:GNAT family N-acetyltransferase [Pendulispora rubella]|uniref:GNAT family N-acetyltransferase n=1 Tax=Pendulispora rubella TaxID=2741070 RepID=A0ABZ2L2G7_9BACT
MLSRKAAWFIMDAMPVPPFHARALSHEDAQQIAQWRYAGPWSIYDAHADDGLLDGNDGYFGLVDASEGRLAGFACIGAEARVPGLAEEAGLVDIGVGMRPDLVGRGFGQAFLAAALDHGRTMLGPVRWRAAVQSWNERSLRLTARLGFRAVGKHTCVQAGKNVEYLVLVTDDAR